MLIENVPVHLRNSIDVLELPIYVDLSAEECRPPANLALGDTLMVLGLIRNQGQPVRLFFDPGPARAIVEAHPLVRELLPPDGAPSRVGLHYLPVGRIGRPGTWVAKTFHRLPVPVLPVDLVKANPAGAHSLHYRLPSLDDRPSVAVDEGCAAAMRGLLSREKPTLVIYPLNPGRLNVNWHDLSWWARLLRRLQGHFAVVAVGGEDYGELQGVADVCLSWKDPLSTLPNLAWLLSRAAAFAGRDGGLSHLAAAVSPHRLTIWDAMSSYRLWATRHGHHLLWSNPYLLRHPQAARITVADVQALVKTVRVIGPDGQARDVPLPRETFKETAAQLFGSVEDMVAAVYAQRQEIAEKASVDSWFTAAEARERTYAASLDFAARAIAGQLPADANWVAPEAQ